jgi:hypothetical protein
MRLTRLAIAALVLLLFSAAASSAQTAALPRPPKRDTRIPLFVVDARGVFAKLGQDKTTAAGLSTSVLDLPAAGVGAAGGAHVYLWRGRTMAFGAGGETMFARAQHTLVDSTGKKTGVVVDRRLKSVSGQLSLNFGRREGWSYVTAGLGPTAFESYLGGATPDGERLTALNFGGGARWFNWEHLAFTADLRFYGTKPANATANTAARLRKTLIVFSGGIAIK